MVPPLEFSFIKDSSAESKRTTNTGNQRKQYSSYIKLKKLRNQNNREGKKSTDCNGQVINININNNTIRVSFIISAFHFDSNVAHSVARADDFSLHTPPTPLPHSSPPPHLLLPPSFSNLPACLHSSPIYPFAKSSAPEHPFNLAVPGLVASATPSLVNSCGNSITQYEGCSLGGVSQRSRCGWRLGGRWGEM